VAYQGSFLRELQRREVNERSGNQRYLIENSTTHGGEKGFQNKIREGGASQQIVHGQGKRHNSTGKVRDKNGTRNQQGKHGRKRARIVIVEVLLINRGCSYLTRAETDTIRRKHRQGPVKEKKNTTTRSSGKNLKKQKPRPSTKRRVSLKMYRQGKGGRSTPRGAGSSTTKSIGRGDRGQESK